MPKTVLSISRCSINIWWMNWMNNEPESYHCINMIWQICIWSVVFKSWLGHYIPSISVTLSPNCLLLPKFHDICYGRTFQEEGHTCIHIKIWGSKKITTDWVKGFLTNLKMDVLSLLKVFNRLWFPLVRPGALAVLSHMLLSFQHSPEAFHLVSYDTSFLHWKTLS